MPNKSRGGSYIGGSTVIRDPARWGKLAGRLRKTKRAQRAAAERKAALDEELAAFRPTTILIKRT